MTVAYECCIANALRKHFHPPKNERTHQDLAQLRVCLHQGEEAFAIELDDFSIMSRTNTCHRTTARKRIDLAGELTSPENRNKRFGCGRRPHSLQFSRNDYQHWNAPHP